MVEKKGRKPPGVWRNRYNYGILKFRDVCALHLDLWRLLTSGIQDAESIALDILGGCIFVGTVGDSRDILGAAKVSRRMSDYGTVHCCLCPLDIEALIYNDGHQLE